MLTKACIRAVAEENYTIEADSDIYTRKQVDTTSLRKRNTDRRVEMFEERTGDEDRS